MSKPEGELESKVLPLPRRRLETEVEKPSPGKAEELYVRAQGRLDSDDYIGAVEDFTAALALDPQHRGAWMGRALGAFYLGDYPGSIRDNTKALALRSSPMAYYNRGIARLRDGDEDGAREDLKKAPEVVLDEARDRFKTRHFNKVVFYAGIALEVAPQNFDALMLRGAALVELGRYEESLRDHAAALKLRRSANVFFNRGLTHRRMNNPAAALADFDEAIALDSEDKDYFWQRGLVKEALGDTGGAFADFTRSLGGPSEQAKREAREQIRKDRRESRGLLAGGTAAWLAALLLLGWKNYFKAQNFWYIVIGGGLIAGMFFWSLEEESSARGLGKGDDDHGIILLALMAVLGPAGWLVGMHLLKRDGTRCRTCKTDAPSGVASCRRCGTPLEAHG